VGNNEASATPPQNTQQNQPKTAQQKTYVAPELTRQGTIEEITQQTNTTSGFDTTFGFGPPPMS